MPGKDWTIDEQDEFIADALKRDEPRLRSFIRKRVLDIEDAPLPGLYAAGELVGGIFYFNYPGATGLTASAVFGRIAGREAGAFAKSNAPASIASRAVCNLAA